MPRGALVLRRVEPCERRMRGALRGEAAAVDDDVERLEVDIRMVRVEHGHEVRADGAGHRRQVVRAVDGRAIEDVVGARGDDDPDPRLDEPLELRRRALDGALRLDVGVEQVARDQRRDRPSRRARGQSWPRRRRTGARAASPHGHRGPRGARQGARRPCGAVAASSRAASPSASRRHVVWRARRPQLLPARLLRTVARHCDRSIGTASTRLTDLRGILGYPSAAFTRCARPRDSSIGTKGRAAPGFGRLPRCRWRRLRRIRTSQIHALRRLLVTYADRTLTCVDCGSEFIHSADDQQYYAEKGFASDPKRCVSCRASRRAARDTGYSASDLGGPRGYERCESRPASTSPSCARSAATRRRSRSGHAWIGRSTAPTASARRTPTDPPRARKHVGARLDSRR